MSILSGVSPFICCITGTDTDAGKTVVSGALALAASRAGRRVTLIKPVQTGCERDAAGELAAPDCEVYREACPQASRAVLAALRPACSPHLAARMSGLRLDAADMARRIRETSAVGGADVVIVEGAGGLMSPLNEGETFLDLLAALQAPVILVAPNRLGAVNHALLSVRMLDIRGVALAGCVFVSPGPEKTDSLSKQIREDNPAIVTRLSGVPLLATLPYEPFLHAKDAAARRRGWESLAAPLVPLFAEPAGLFTRPARTACTGKENSLAFDKAHLWHPYTSALRPLPVREAVATKGTRIFLRGGASLVDGMASWWCAIHGYNHPLLLRALHEQGERMPHVMFGGLTHAPAVSLARQLLRIAPAGLEHVFFADSGSVAVEVALKMALQYQQAAGCAAKSRILTVRGGYHGDTFGAMSVCDPVTGMHALFKDVLPRQFFAPRPGPSFGAPYDASAAEGLERLFTEHGGSVAALVLEPIVQGAGGMRIYHPEYLRRARALCGEYGTLLVLDEIATGFGRTGKLFASEWAGVSPDIMCVGKALTGGVMTLSAVLASAEVAHGISRDGGVLMHGPTFMANPLACAVAGASLGILEQGAWERQVARIEAVLRKELEPCRSLPGVADVRVLGAIGVLEMERPVDVPRLQNFFIKKGVWIRPFSRLIYVMPPYIIAEEELMLVARSMRDAVAEGQWE